MKILGVFRLLKGGQLGLFKPVVGAGGPRRPVVVHEHLRRTEHGIELVTEHQRHIEASRPAHATVAPPATTETPTTTTGDGEAPIVESPATIETPMPSASDAPAAAPSSPAVPSVDDIVSEHVARNPPEHAASAESAVKAEPEIRDEIADVENDRAWMFVHVRDLEHIRAKAKELGIEVEESPASIDDVLRQWRPEHEAPDGTPIYSKKQHAEAAARAEHYRQLVFHAPKHSERIVGVASRKDATTPVFSNVRMSKTEAPYFTKDRVEGFDFGRCDHCGKRIERNTAFIVAHKDGRFEQIGGTCASHLNLAQKLKDQLDAFAKLKAWAEESEYGGLGHGRRADFSPSTIAAAIEYIRRRHGYVSRKMTEEDEEKYGRRRRTPTAEHAIGLLNTIADVRAGKSRQMTHAEIDDVKKVGDAIDAMAVKEGPTLLADIAAHGDKVWEDVKPGDDATFAANLRAATHEPTSRRAGLVAFAMHVTQKDKGNDLRLKKSDYTPESHEEKLRGEDPDTLARKLGVEPRAITRAIDTGKIPKSLAGKLDRYVPGTWKVLGHRVSTGQFGDTHHYDLQRVTDGAMLHWTASDPEYATVDPSFVQPARTTIMPYRSGNGAEHILRRSYNKVRTSGEGYEEGAARHDIEQGDHLEIHGASVDEKPAGESTNPNTGKTYHNWRRINRATMHRALEPGETPEPRPIPEPGSHYTYTYRDDDTGAERTFTPTPHLRPGVRRKAVDRFLGGQGVQSLEEANREGWHSPGGGLFTTIGAIGGEAPRLPAYVTHPTATFAEPRQSAGAVTSGRWDRPGSGGQPNVAEETHPGRLNETLASHLQVNREGEPLPGWGWEGEDVRPTDKPEHVHPAFHHLLPMRKAVPAARVVAELRIVGGELVELEKGGEGSRGGHVIGHTRSGRPIYAPTSAAMGDPGTGMGSTPEIRGTWIHRRVGGHAAVDLETHHGRYRVRSTDSRTWTATHEPKAKPSEPGFANMPEASGAAEIITHGNVGLDEAMHVARMHAHEIEGERLAKAMPPGMGGMMRPPPPEPDARPPHDRVKFRHPETGEVRRGTVQAGGSHGVTVVDDQDGRAHRVHHGHYVVDDEELKPPGKGAAGAGDKAPTPEEGRQSGTEKADADAKYARLKHTAEQLPKHRARAQRDMRHGVNSHVAHKAAAALLTAHTGRPTHDLKAKDVDVKGSTIKVRHTPNQQSQAKDKHLAAFIGAAKAGRKPDDPMFGGKNSRGQVRPVTRDDVDDHLGAHGDGMTQEDVSRYHATREAAEGNGKAPQDRPAEHVDPTVAAAMKNKGTRMPDKAADPAGGEKDDGADERERRFRGMLDRVDGADPTGRQSSAPAGEGADPDADGT